MSQVSIKQTSTDNGAINESVIDLGMMSITVFSPLSVPHERILSVAELVQTKLKTG